MGDWQGYLKVTSCVADGPTQCDVLSNIMVGFQLSVSSATAALLTISRHPSYDALGLNLTGVLNSDGSTTFTGTESYKGGPTFPYNALSATVRSLTIRKSAASGLSGTIDWVANYCSYTEQGCGSMKPVALTASVLSGLDWPAAATSTSFIGRWLGQLVVTSCDGVCDIAGAYPAFDAELDVSQGGTDAVADFWWHANQLFPRSFHVAGSVTAQNLSLSGSMPVPPCTDHFTGNFFCQVQLRSLHAFIDSSGVLQGTLEYFEEGWYTNTSRYSFTWTAKLLGLIRTSVLTDPRAVRGPIR